MIKNSLPKENVSRCSESFLIAESRGNLKIERLNKKHEMKLHKIQINKTCESPIKILSTK